VTRALAHLPFPLWRLPGYLKAAIKLAAPGRMQYHTLHPGCRQAGSLTAGDTAAAAAGLSTLAPAPSVAP
jgi:hypothetical protein